MRSLVSVPVPWSVGGQAAPGSSVEPVLDDVEKQPAHVDDAEVMHPLVDLVELVAAIGVDHDVLQRLGPLDRPAVQRHHLVHRHPIGRGVS
mgnify:CR=1 FL=1